MHLAFVDIVYGYTADRPDMDEPLGGTTSAICYTARELAKAGVNCTFFNTTPAQGEAHGIKSLPLAALAEECVKPDYTAFIFCGRWLPDMVRVIRQHTKTPLIAWMHEASFNNQLVTSLPEFDAAVYVSEWQKRVNQAQAQKNWKEFVIRNAMNPAAADMHGPDESILSAKKKPPILLFAGAVPRGVMHLPPILDELRKRRTDFTMEIYCNTNPSGQEEQDRQYIEWLRSLPNITHVGMMGQRELVQRMKQATLFVAPNPWPETSCIALIEAMAAGLSVITTNRAALPETAAGFAQHIAIEDSDNTHRFNMPVPSKAFAEAIYEKLEQYEKQPDIIEKELRKQIAYAHAHYQWKQRAECWIGLLQSLRGPVC